MRKPLLTTPCTPQMKKYRDILKIIRVLLYVAVAIVGFYSVSSVFPQTIKQAEMFQPVVSTITPLHDISLAVTAKARESVQLLPEGVSARGWSLHSHQEESIKKNFVLLAVGMELDKWAYNNLSDKTDLITLEMLSEPIINNGKPNPYLWLSPKNMISMTEALALKLSKKDDIGAKLYQLNADRYIAKLNELDQQLHELSQCPNVSYIFLNEAFAYLARDYGLKVSTQKSTQTPLHLTTIEQISTQQRTLGIDYITAMRYNIKLLQQAADCPLKGEK